MDDNKKQTLMATLKQIEKQFGKGAVMRLGDSSAVLDVDTVSTGSLNLDLALGIGGLPRGRVVEIYGPEASGKTTLTLHVAAEIQKKGGIAAFIDAEHALDSQYAKRLGVNTDELLLSQPGSGEEALEIADIFVRSGTVDLVIIDSVAALTPKAEIEGDMGDSHMGLHARLMSQALRKLTANIKRSNTLVIFINQIRMKIGVVWGCFHYDSPVILANGQTRKIGEIVEGKLPLTVLSYNLTTQQLEPRPIVNWYNNGETEEFWQFTLNTATESHQITCTANHLLLTPTGYQAAGELALGDELMIALPHSPTIFHHRLLEQLPTPVLQNHLLPNLFKSRSPIMPLAISNIQRITKTHCNQRFDLEIEGNHNYLVNHVVVHNSPETTTGGNALKFYASVRLDIRRTGPVKRGDEIVGNETKVKVVKNKLAPPLKEVSFDIIYGEGISRIGELIDLGVKCEIIDKAGTWYSYSGERLGQGKDNMRNYLLEHPEIAASVEKQIREKMLAKPLPTTSSESTDISKEED